MTKGLETLAKKEGIEKNQEYPELAKIKGSFERYEKEMRYLRNFLSIRRKAAGESSIAGSNTSERWRQKRIRLNSSSQYVRPD